SRRLKAGRPPGVPAGAWAGTGAGGAAAGKRSRAVETDGCPTAGGSGGARGRRGDQGLAPCAAHRPRARDRPSLPPRDRTGWTDRREGRGGRDRGRRRRSEEGSGDRFRSPRGGASGAETVSASEAPPRGERRMELSRVRRTTAKRMSESKREVPHFYASSDIRMDEAVRLKATLADLGGEFEGITFTHLVLKAVGIALTRVPEVNASYDGDAIVLHDTVHVGIATAVETGLIVPVVHDCDRQPLGALVRQARALVERARAGRFESADLIGGTFTLSNLGMYPVSTFAAVINPPQAAILAVGAIRDVPVVEGSHVVPGRLMTVTLSCDHRIIDGVIAGRFLAELSGLLTRPLALVV